MNRVLSVLPVPGGDSYTALAPKWFTHLLRLVSLAFGLAVLWFSVHDWSSMPLWVQALACVLVPAFFLMAFHPRGWAQFSSTPFFHADDLGMYFPSTRPQVLGSTAPPRWLFVPWENISNLRVDKAVTSEGKSTCAAFDVVATPDEVSEFLYDALATKHFGGTGSTAVAFYLHWPPHPRKVVASLLELTRRHP